MDIDSLKTDRTKVRIKLADGTESIAVIQSDPDDNEMILVEDVKQGPMLISMSHIAKISIYFPNAETQEMQM